MSKRGSAATAPCSIHAVDKGEIETHQPQDFATGALLFAALRCGRASVAHGIDAGEGQSDRIKLFKG